jgi:hypothetical protein
MPDAMTYDGEAGLLHPSSYLHTYLSTDLLNKKDVFNVNSHATCRRTWSYYLCLWLVFSLFI